MLTLLTLLACGEEDTAVNPTHDVHIQPIWSSTCGPGCHTGGSASGDLALDEGYAATLGVPSSVEGYSLVVPGDLDNSYLWLKLEGTHDLVGGEGSKMPLGNSLTDEELALIEAWIADGAPQ